LARLLLPAAPLLALAGVCFARLIVEPGGLIVDGQRPSVDYANRGDPRPVGNDLVFLFLPHHWSIAQRLSEFGHWPVWDARGFGGRPLLGNPQAGMFYPPVWIAWKLRVPATLGWLTVGHLLWAGLGVYVLVRAMGQCRWASTVAAGVYQASPLLLAHTFEGHYPHVWAVCWYPWAFWAFRDYRNGRNRGLLSLPLILTATYLTGHPQEWLLLVLALSVWAIWDLISATPGVRVRQQRESEGSCHGARGAPNKPRKRFFSQPFNSWIAILGLSVGMAAVDVLPQLAVRAWLRRSHEPGLETGVPRRYHLGGMNLFQLASPTALGGPADYFGDDNYWETVCSIGLMGFVLAMIAAARHPDRRLVRGWLILAGLTIAFACGRSLGLYPLLFSAVPGMAWFRVPARSLFLANLAGAVLAGLGVETIRLRITGVHSWRRFARRFAFAAVILVGTLFLVQFGRVPQPGLAQTRGTRSSQMAPASPPASRRTAQASARVLHDGGFWLSMVGMGVIVFLGCRTRSDAGRRRLGSLIGLIALVELGWSGFSLIRVTPAARFLGPDPFCARTGHNHHEGCRLLGTAPNRWTPTRIKARDSFLGDLPAAVHGIEKTNVDDAFQLDHAAVLYETLYPVASRVRPMSERLLSPSAKEAWRRIRRAVLDRMSVTHIVSDRFEPDPGWPVEDERKWDDSPLVIQRNPTAMPRAYVVPRATILPDQPGVVLTSLSDLDPHDSVVMSTDPLDSMPTGSRQLFTPARWTSTDPDRPALQVTTGAPGLLVVADTWMPGWTATVDGRPSLVLRGNQAQRVILLLEPGRHVVVMEYRPPGWLSGRAITVLSLMIWMVMAGFFVCRGRASDRGGPVRFHSDRGTMRRRRCPQFLHSPGRDRRAADRNRSRPEMV
jgi:hypothetical protein